MSEIRLNIPSGFENLINRLKVRAETRRLAFRPTSVPAKIGHGFEVTLQKYRSYITSYQEEEKDKPSIDFTRPVKPLSPGKWGVVYIGESRVEYPDERGVIRIGSSAPYTFTVVRTLRGQSMYYKAFLNPLV